MAGEYFDSDLIEMGAACVFHIVKRYPFLDSNKRVGAVAALVFLELNGLGGSSACTIYEPSASRLATGAPRSGLREGASPSYWYKRFTAPHAVRSTATTQGAGRTEVPSTVVTHMFE